jgi:hypothetical protein
MKIKEFTLINAEKLGRALNGSQRSDGNFFGGVGNGAYFEDGAWKRNGAELEEKEIDALESAILAEYDRLGGLIKKNEDKVETGSFYNFKARKPHDKPAIIFTYKINGKTVQVPDGKELPGEVKAAKILAEQESNDRKEDEDEEGKAVKKGKKK